MSSTVIDLGRVIRRDDLLNRLSRLGPELIALVAPAGFGKSSLALQFLEGRERFAICDCAGVTDDLELARRLIFALADEDPSRGAALSQRELLLGDGTMSRAERVNLAVAAWREPSLRATFLIENMEYLGHAPSALELVFTLLRERPPGRTVALSSRENLRMHLSRFAPPHRIVTFRAEDLAFSRFEIDQLFAPLSLEATALDRIHDITQGWPILVLFLARLASEGRHEAVLERLGDVAFGELYEYLADQVVAALPGPVATALFAAACIEHATSQDLILATGEATAPGVLSEFARSSPFVRYADGRSFVVHPFMGAMLVENESERRSTLLATAAERYDRLGKHLRAAELHLARRDHDAAAKSLEQVPLGDYRAPSMRYSRALSSLDRIIVRQYPTLWACNALLQTFCIESEQLLEETGIMWASLPAETPLQKRYYVLATRALLLTYLGRFAEALAVIDTVAPREKIPEVPVTREHGYALYLRGTVLGRLGRIEEAERELQLAWPLVESMDAMASATLVIQATEVERVRGHSAKERELLSRSLDYARRAELSNFACFRLAELVISCWFQGNDHEFGQYTEELERIVDRDGIRGFRYFTSCLRGRPGEPAKPDLLRWIIWGHLVAATNAGDRADAYAFALAAQNAAVRYPSPYLRTLASIAVAELADGKEKSLAYESAARFAEGCGSKAFVDAVAAERAGTENATMLSVFVRRLRASTFARGIARLEVSVLTGIVSARGVVAKLGDRELELLLVLARRRKATSRDELVEALWPDRDDDSATNNLKVCIHRIRQHLGDDGVIERTRDGIRLCQDAVVDLWEIERAAAELRSHDVDSEDDIAAIRALFERLCVERPARFAAWEWFMRIERFLQELRFELGRRLALHAISKGRPSEALQLATGLMVYDACHEGAHEVAIAAHLADGNRAAAVRAFRRYREILKAELDCEPSSAISALLHVDGKSDGPKV